MKKKYPEREIASLQHSTLTKGIIEWVRSTEKKYRRLSYWKNI